MSPSSVRCLLAMMIGLLLIACGGTTTGADEPQTAKEKQLAEAKASGELDNNKGKNWGTWKYKGDHDNCFYVVGRTCFKTEKAACSSLACGNKKKKCKSVGGGPATVSCK